LFQSLPRVKTELSEEADLSESDVNLAVALAALSRTPEQFQVSLIKTESTLTREGLPSGESGLGTDAQAPLSSFDKHVDTMSHIRMKGATGNDSVIIISGSDDDDNKRDNNKIGAICVIQDCDGDHYEVVELDLTRNITSFDITGIKTENDPTPLRSPCTEHPPGWSSSAKDEPSPDISIKQEDCDNEMDSSENLIPSNDFKPIFDAETIFSGSSSIHQVCAGTQLQVSDEDHSSSSGGDVDHNIHSTQRRRYPLEVQLDGAQPSISGGRTLRQQRKVSSLHMTRRL
jgi:hypothetical protein